MNVIGKRFWFFLISGVFIIIGIIALSTYGFKSSIEFSSGSILGVKFETPVDYNQFKQAVTKLGYSDAIVQSTTSGTAIQSTSSDFTIRTRELTDAERIQIETSLADSFGKLSETQFSRVPALVAAETARNAILAVIVAMVGILLYVTWAFRKMPKPFRFGTCSVIALFHDVLVTGGLFSLLGGLLGWEINLMFITGILTIIGYSINNTIVVFDRIRENETKGLSADFESVVNSSVVETMGRSFNTSITVLIVTVALLIFVGATIQNFAVVLLIGNIIGTFDSVFVAPGLLVVWDKGEWGRFIGRKAAAPAKA